MKRVFLLWNGLMEDTRLAGVFTTEELAAKHAAKLKYPDIYPVTLDKLLEVYDGK